MDDKIYINQEQIVDKLKSLLDIKYIYKIRHGKEESLKPLLILILKGGCSSLTTELSSMVAKIFEEEKDFLYRIFSFEYAQKQLIDENLFFVNGCNWSNIIYHEPSSELDTFFKYYSNEKILSRIEKNFKNEQYKIAAFLEGAYFFIENKNLPQAAFMLHQCIELWFRFAALFIMGKERKSHSIKELQTYIKSYKPALGMLFNTELESEQQLLKLLDDAYVATRYESNYYITQEQVTKLLEKAKAVGYIVVDAFEQKLYDIDNNSFKISNKMTSESNNIKQENDAILKFIKSLKNKDFSSLKPYAHKKGLYTIGIMTPGYLETSFMISNLLKVCILAMEYEYAPTRSIPDPTHNVKEVLGYILDLIPHEEMELLDVLRDLTITRETIS